VTSLSQLMCHVADSGQMTSFYSHFLTLNPLTDICSAQSICFCLCNRASLLYCICFQAERSNKRHRPIGIGVQGLADTFLMMRYAFESDEAQRLNRDIFETIYYSALRTSCELARLHGPYETYGGSPVSHGVRFECGCFPC